MEELQKARELIDRIDHEMARLFAMRLDAAKMVAAYKIKNGLPIDDLDREAEIIKRNSKYIENNEYEAYYVDFLKNNIQLSKEVQRRQMEREASAGVQE